MRIAILDFGTNIFNLLIADNDEQSGLRYIHTSKEPVKLGQGGIIDQVLQPEAIERGIQAIENHYRTIRDYKVEKIYAYATSAIRDAKNSRQFLDIIRKRFDLYVNIIPGDREAELIYKGVRHACNFSNQKVLILDIGGGSNECIIADKTRIYWQESYNLGMARLLERFKPEDPISEETLYKIEEFLENRLTSLFSAIEKYDPVSLIGAAGFFETFFALIRFRLPEKYIKKDLSALKKEIYLEDFRGLHKILLDSTMEQRKIMPGMELARIEMIVLASIFISLILKNRDFKKMILSEYALKEGVIAEILNI